MATNVPMTRLQLDHVIRQFPFHRKPKRSQAEKYPDSRENRLHGSLDSKVFGFKVPTLNSGFKISRDTTKPGSFHFGFVHFCINGKINPALKHSGIITNPEQFPLV